MESVHRFFRFFKKKTFNSVEAITEHNTQMDQIERLTGKMLNGEKCIEKEIRETGCEKNKMELKIQTKKFGLLLVDFVFFCFCLS